MRRRGRGVGGGDVSPRRHAVTDPPRCLNMKTCQSREKHPLTDNVLCVITHRSCVERLSNYTKFMISASALMLN